MLTGLFVIFSILIVFSFTEDYLGKYKWLIFIIIGLTLILYAGFRPVGFDRDSPNYEAFFMHPDSKESAISVEPTFLWICNFGAIILQDVRIVLLIFAIIGVTIKLLAIKKNSPILFLPLVIYFGNFYYLHELTQIRAGIAAAFFLLALPYQAEGKKAFALILVLLACSFHYSAFVLLPFLLCGNKAIGGKMKIAITAIVPLCFVLYALNLDLLTSVPLPYVSEKIEAYKMASEYGNIEKNSILNPFPIIRIAILLFVLFYSETIAKYEPYIYLYIKAMVCSLLIYFALSSITIVSTRFFELFGIVEIVAYPCIIYAIKPRVIGKLFVCIIAVIEMIFNTLIWNFFDFSV